MQESSNPINIDVPAFQEQVQKAIDVILFAENLDPEQVQPYSSGFEASKQEAEKYVARQEVKQTICQSLQALTGDIFEIANGITPVLVGAIVAGQITMPLNPLLFGWIALLLFRTGVKTFCAEDSKD
jgi:CobQ-like glutamine amidotransferase family enzyme